MSHRGTHIVFIGTRVMLSRLDNLHLLILPEGHLADNGLTSIIYLQRVQAQVLKYIRLRLTHGPVFVT